MRFEIRTKLSFLRRGTARGRLFGVLNVVCISEVYAIVPRWHYDGRAGKPVSGSLRRKETSPGRYV